jgi:hypothetical protein
MYPLLSCLGVFPVRTGCVISDGLFRCYRNLRVAQFVSRAAECVRVIAPGEGPVRLHAIRSPEIPELDRYAQRSGVALDEGRRHYEFNFEKYGTAVFHPVMSEVGTMKSQAASLDNTSVGAREAPFLGVPSLDVGSRQSRRASSPSITAVSALDAQAIDAFLVHEWGRRYPPDHTFGTGRAAEGFVEVLAQPGFWALPLQKGFIGSEVAAG